ncbi:MAG: O-antigen ligase family protein [Patescibacteria group bacterium]
MNSYLRWGIVMGLLVTLFLPMVVSSSLFFPFITGKNFGFRIIVEIVLALWLILALRDPAYRPKKTLLLGLVTALLVVLAFATAYAIDPYRAFWSNQERMEGLISFIHLFAYFIVLTSVLKTERAWFWFWHTSIGVSVMVGIHGLLQLAGKAEVHQGSARLDASLGNASYLAVYMLVHIFITAIYLRRRIKEKSGNWIWYFYLPIIVLQFINLYYTATRGSLLGFFGGAFLTAFLVAVFERQSKVVRKGAISALALMILFLGFFLAFKNSDFIKTNPVLGRFSDISVTSGSTNARFLIWNMSLQGFKEHPVLGWGPDNYMFLFNKYYNPKMYAQEQWFDRSHNVFFDWLISAGVLGLGLYLSLFVLALYYLWRKITDWGLLEKSLFTGLLLAYFVHNIFVFDQLISYLSFFSLLAYFNWRWGVNQSALVSNLKMPPALTNSFGVVILVALATIFYFVNIKPINASATLIKAISSNQQTGAKGSLELFKKVLNAKTFVSGEAREQLASLVLGVIGSDQYDDNFKKEFFTLAVTELETQAKKIPGDARSRVFLGNLLRSTGNLDLATQIFKEAVTASPNKQTILFQLGETYLSAGKIKEGIEVFKKAFELEPKFEEARKYYALSLILAKDIKQSDALLMEGFGTTTIKDSNFIRAYNLVGLPARAKLLDN